MAASDAVEIDRTMAAHVAAATDSRTRYVDPLTTAVRQPVAFRSGDLALLGYLFKPDGDGPFPAVLWNHGSEFAPGRGPQFDALANVFLPAGYVLFAPVRRGHEGSEGSYIVDDFKAAGRAGSAEEANRLVVQKLETEQLDDQLSGLAFLRGLPFVDEGRIVVAGWSYGGIQTLLGAERGAGYQAALAISPAAMSWEGNAALRARLLDAVGGTEIPVMLLQPPLDTSLEPSRVLGDEFRRLGKAFTGKVYPAEGPQDEQMHCFGGPKGMHIWTDDALAFLEQALR